MYNSSYFYFKTIEASMFEFTVKILLLSHKLERRNVSSIRLFLPKTDICSSLSYNYLLTNSCVEKIIFIYFLKCTLCLYLSSWFIIISFHVTLYYLDPNAGHAEKGWTHRRCSHCRWFLTVEQRSTWSKTVRFV